LKKCCFLLSGHSSTVWALSFNAEGDRMVTCRYVKLFPKFDDHWLGWYLFLRYLETKAIEWILGWLCSDDLTLKIWETDVGRMVLGDDHAPWWEACSLCLLGLLLSFLTSYSAPSLLEFK
jgi:hypothetical protein